MKLLIKNGRVIDPKTNLDQITDVLIENGKVKEIASSINETGCKVVDATGKIVAPGFVDIHVHLREPGFGHKETLKTCADIDSRRLLLYRWLTKMEMSRPLEITRADTGSNILILRL